MKIYLVGGAVRDQLLGLPVKEKDWVVVGATPAEMLAQGYKQVGKDFPVFLHPDTHEEYALARMERKIGKGYTGFDFDASTAVTLEDDLLRRDLTINAIAQTPDGAPPIDPFKGCADLEAKVLRHVSPAFVEDPVRILRIARFSARFASLGFAIAPETLTLMKAMVTAGEVDALVAERVWKELEKALQENDPAQFFIVLNDCHALAILFPEITSRHIELLAQVAARTEDIECRCVALLFHCSVEQIKQLCDRYRVSIVFRELALITVQHHEDFINAAQLSAEQLLNLFLSLDAFRRKDRFVKWLAINQFLVSSKHDEKTQAKPSESDNCASYLKKAYEMVSKINFDPKVTPGLKGKEIGESINKQRLEALQLFVKPSPPQQENGR